MNAGHVKVGCYKDGWGGLLDTKTIIPLKNNYALGLVNMVKKSLVHFTVIAVILLGIWVELSTPPVSDD
jgi:hypothetical protein